MGINQFALTTVCAGLALAIGCSTSSQRKPADSSGADDHQVKLDEPLAASFSAAQSSLDFQVESRAWASQTGDADEQTIGAVEYCSSKGSRLPTARELAQIATQMGAKGILEKNVVDSELKGVAPEGYFLVATVNSDGTKDQFYYNFSGYVPPADGSAKLLNWWSSSVQSGYSNYSYVLLGKTGNLFPSNRFTQNLALCVQKIKM
jgi:hypothetical protein